MPGFCTGCGAPLAGAFCGRCGKAAQAASTPPQPATQPSTPAQPAAQPFVPQSAASVQSPAAAASAPVQAQASMPPTAVKKSGAGKVLLIIGVLLVGLFALGIGGALYGLHWMKAKVSGLTGGAIGGSGQVQVAKGNACSLLSRDELQQVLGVAVERSSEIMQGNEPGCAYYTNPAAFAELQKIAVAQAKRDSERVSNDPANKNVKNDNPLELLKHTEEMEGIVKGLGLSAPDPDGKVFAFTVDRNFGRENWGPLRATMSVVPGFKEINGVGDRAMMGSFGHAFYVLNGDSMINMETMYVPEIRVRGAELGRKLVSHM
ncbi:MAG: hypothetical protein WA738_10710 [Candidatus Angelobacter sp.]